LAEVGQQVPVVVIRDADRLVLIDGYLRVEALVHHRHLAGAKRIALEDAWLLGRLREHGLTMEQLARQLCRSTSWVSRRLGLLDALDGSAQDRVRAGPGSAPIGLASEGSSPSLNDGAQYHDSTCEHCMVQIRTFAELEFVPKAENIVFIGPTGIGKTGLASALLLKALQNGHRGVFMRAQDLFDEMYASIADRLTRRLLDRLVRVDVLVIDEMGYLNLQPEQTNILFKLMEGRYRQHATIITTNLDYSEWANFLGNKALVGALLSRLRHQCHTVKIDGPSLRTIFEGLASTLFDGNADPGSISHESPSLMAMPR
jgi:hypothetical protein